MENNSSDTTNHSEESDGDDIYDEYERDLSTGNIDFEPLKDAQNGSHYRNYQNKPE